MSDLQAAANAAVEKLKRLGRAVRGATEDEVRDAMIDLTGRGVIDPVRLNGIVRQYLEPQKLMLRAQQLVLRASRGDKAAAAELQALAPRFMAMAAEMVRLMGELADCLEPLIDELEAKWETRDGRRMRKTTAAKWRQLKAALKAKGYDVVITSTNTGDHLDPRHRLGKAIDFVVLVGGKPIGAANSEAVAAICRAQGWRTFNEYIQDSPKKTGSHMHVDL